MRIHGLRRSTRLPCGSTEREKQERASERARDRKPHTNPARVRNLCSNVLERSRSHAQVDVHAHICVVEMRRGGSEGR
jgi:hypothetical protein